MTLINFTCWKLSFAVGYCIPNPSSDLRHKPHVSVNEVESGSNPCQGKQMISESQQFYYN